MVAADFGAKLSVRVTAVEAVARRVRGVHAAPHARPRAEQVVEAAVLEHEKNNGWLGCAERNQEQAE